MSTAVELYARARPGSGERAAHAAALLSDAARRHPGRIVLATSLGVEDMVVADLIARHRLPIALATLDTGQLHQQTLALIPQLEAHYGLAVERFTPRDEQVVHFVARHGELAMRASVELRKACCAMRKLEPLGRLLEGRSAWITGLRREQSGARADVPFRSTDENGREKLSPLADWSLADVWHYVQIHGVPYNPLHDAFFPSIGCAPCTRAVALGEDFRAGRWWWEHEGAKECGLHSPQSSDAPASAAAQGAAVAFGSAQGHIGAADVGRSQNESPPECGLHSPRSSDAPASAAAQCAAVAFGSAQGHIGAADVGRSQNESPPECGLHVQGQKEAA